MSVSATPCIESILARTTYDKLEIIVVSSGAGSSQWTESLLALQDAGVLQVSDSATDFDAAALTNRAVALARGERLVFKLLPFF